MFYELSPVIFVYPSIEDIMVNIFLPKQAIGRIQSDISKDIPLLILEPGLWKNFISMIPWYSIQSQK